MGREGMNGIMGRVGKVVIMESVGIDRSMG